MTVETESAPKKKEAKAPKWVPSAILITGAFLIGSCIVAAAFLAFTVLGALHSYIPWWGIIITYAGIMGALARIHRERKALRDSASTYWGVFSRWARSLA